MDYFQLPLKYYGLSGLRESSSSSVKIFSLYILYPLLFVLLLLICIDFRFKHNNISEIAEVFISLSTFTHLLIRKTILRRYGPQIENLNKKRTFLWKYNLFVSSEKKFNENMSFSVSFIKSIWMISILSISVHSTAPFLVDDLDLPHACWVPFGNNTIRTFIHILETIFFSEVCLLVGVFDGFYLLMCTELKVQFELLAKMINSINIEKNGEIICWKTLKLCYNHHRFLLQIHEELNNIFSKYFICLYLLGIGGICIPLFVILDEKSNIIQVTESIIYISFNNAVIIMAAFPPTEVEIAVKAEHLTSHIYSIDWYNTRDLKISKFIFFWLYQSQAPVYMLGAKILQVNRTLILRMQRVGYSVSSVMTGLK